MTPSRWATLVAFIVVAVYPFLAGEPIGPANWFCIATIAIYALAYFLRLVFTNGRKNYATGGKKDPGEGNFLKIT